VLFIVRKMLSSPFASSEVTSLHLYKQLNVAYAQRRTRRWDFSHGAPQVWGPLRQSRAPDDLFYFGQHFFWYAPVMPNKFFF
jgi:hypothetical protein